ncbi:MAG: T9SS type A sorting domain-containing protein [Bacteroidales bacterium]|nr:T9SS type A sorting domain-containing protein [Bacteroidales bacterium]
MQKQLKAIGLTIVLLLLIVTTASAQTAITSLGGDVASPAGSLNYTIGQIDASSAIGQGQASLNEGVQQTYTAEELRIRIPNKDMIILAYPNPTVDGVFVEIPSSEIGVHYELLTTHGSILKSGTLTGTKQKIDMNVYPVSSYILRIVGKDYECDFKIVKIK